MHPSHPSDEHILSVGDILYTQPTMSYELRTDIANYCETMATLKACFASPTTSYPPIDELVRFVTNVNAPYVPHQATRQAQQAMRQQYYTTLTHTVTTDCTRYSPVVAVRRLWSGLSCVHRHMYIRTCVYGTTYYG